MTTKTTVVCNPIPATSLSAVTKAIGGIDLVVGFAAITVSWPDCLVDPLSLSVQIALTGIDTPSVSSGNATALLDPLVASRLEDAALRDAVHAFTGTYPAFAPGVQLAPLLVR
jgi:hypothetical protein